MHRSGSIRENLYQVCFLAIILVLKRTQNLRSLEHAALIPLLRENTDMSLLGPVFSS